MLEVEGYNPTTITELNIEQELKLSAENYASVVETLVGGKARVVIIGKNKWYGFQGTLIR